MCFLWRRDTAIKNNIMYFKCSPKRGWLSHQSVNALEGERDVTAIDLRANFTADQCHWKIGTKNWTSSPEKNKTKPRLFTYSKNDWTASWQDRMNRSANERTKENLSVPSSPEVWPVHQVTTSPSQWRQPISNRQGQCTGTLRPIYNIHKLATGCFRE